MKTKIIMLVSVLMLTACSTYNQPKAEINRELLAPCAAVVVLDKGDRQSVMKNITLNSYNQQECIDRHSKLVKAVSP